MQFANIFSKLTIEISKFLNCKFQEFEKKLFFSHKFVKIRWNFQRKNFSFTERRENSVVEFNFVAKLK